MSPIRQAPAPTIHQTLESILGQHQDQTTAKRLVVDVEMAADERTTVCGPDLVATLERLIAVAIERCPEGSELCITTFHSERGLEIEVADSGEFSQANIHPHQLRAFASEQAKQLPGAQLPTDRWAAGVTRGHPGSTSRFENFYCTRCPQGGLAWTVVMPSAATARRAA